MDDMVTAKMGPERIGVMIRGFFAFQLMSTYYFCDMVSCAVEVESSPTRAEEDESAGPATDWPSLTRGDLEAIKTTRIGLRKEANVTDRSVQPGRIEGTYSVSGACPSIVSVHSRKVSPFSALGGGMSFKLFRTPNYARSDRL